MSNYSRNGQPCASRRWGAPGATAHDRASDRAKIDAPQPGVRPHYARSPARCEACGLAEPDHAVSVNGRAAEPINSVRGALSGGIRAAAREPRAGWKDAEAQWPKTAPARHFSTIRGGLQCRAGGGIALPKVTRRHPTVNCRVQQPLREFLCVLAINNLCCITVTDAKTG